MNDTTAVVRLGHLPAPGDSIYWPGIDTTHIWASIQFPQSHWWQSPSLPIIIGVVVALAIIGFVAAHPPNAEGEKP